MRWRCYRRAALPCSSRHVHDDSDMGTKCPPFLAGTEGIAVLDRAGQDRLPARPVPAAAVRGAVTTAAATAHLLVAVAAIDGLVAARLEWHTRLTPARAAGGHEHLAATAGSATIHGGLARSAALRATGRGVHQPTAGIELLLAGREQEFTSAFATTKCLIGGQGRTSLCRLQPHAMRALQPPVCPVTMQGLAENRGNPLLRRTEVKSSQNQGRRSNPCQPPTYVYSVCVIPVHTQEL